MFKVKAQFMKLLVAVIFLALLILGVFAIDFTIRKWYIKKAVREALTEMRLEAEQSTKTAPK
ncbi:TPA: hypothetical protein DEG75_03500 [Candidatus Dependentiae bacterium]|nr:hypothetical protein [Candidatus Dependentiae bacterium]